MAPLNRLRTERLFHGRIVAPGGIKFAGTIHNHPGEGRPKLRFFGSYALLYITHGRGNYEDSVGNRRELRAGSLVWIFPDIGHGYGPSSAGAAWDEAYLVFDGEIFDLWRKTGLISPDDPVWQLDPVDFWWKRIDSLLHSTPPAGKESAFLHLSQIQGLVAEMRAASRGAPESRPSWVTEACRSLASDTRPDLPRLAARLGLSYQIFRKRFTCEVGVSPGDYHQARRIDRACSLLMDVNLSNKEIAQRLGFCDEFHFSKTFSQRLGFSPRAFRKKAVGQK